MNINKTADECIVESASVLLKCFVDPNYSIIEKQNFTKWLTCFFDYQDAINTTNKTQINSLNEKLRLTYAPSYYKKALQEFQTANFLYDKNFSLQKLGMFFLAHSTKPTIKTVNTFVQKIIKTIKSYNIELDSEFIANFQILIFAINHHLTYLFHSKLKATVHTFTKIIKTTIEMKKTRQETLLIEAILHENEKFFNNVQQVELSNFIYKLDDIFQETFNIQDVDEKIKKLIFTKPKKLNISMHQLFKDNNIDFYQEIWKEDDVDEKKSKLLMHLFAYETYFVQGYGNHEIYENLVLKNIITEEKYWILLHKYKLANKITKK